MDLRKETVLLNKSKAIDVSKIISNEKRQAERIKELENIIKSKDSIISVKDSRIAQLIKNTNNIGSSILKVTEDIQAITEKQNNVGQKDPTKGFFGILEFGYTKIPDLNIGNIGIGYLDKTRFYSFKVNLLNDELIFTGGFAFKF